MTLLPDGQNNVSTDWIPVGESFVFTALTSDDDLTSYAKCDDVNESMIMEFANPSVAEGDITSIDSVRFLSSGKSIHRTATTRISIQAYTPSGNATEIAVYLAHRTDWTTINGTALPYSDGLGGTDWSYANLEALTVRITMASIVEVYLSYLAMEVTYTAAVTDNATFFGANF